jgi:hypothetical protein
MRREEDAMDDKFFSAAKIRNIETRRVTIKADVSRIRLGCFSAVADEAKRGGQHDFSKTPERRRTA